MASRALAMHAASVSISLRQGITIETSTAAGAWCAGAEGWRATFIAVEGNGDARDELAVWRKQVPWRGVGPRRGHLSPPRKQMTPTDRLLRAGTCLAACSCPLERFPRGRCKQ